MLCITSCKMTQSDKDKQIGRVLKESNDLYELMWSESVDDTELSAVGLHNTQLHCVCQSMDLKVKHGL